MVLESLADLLIGINGVDEGERVLQSLNQKIKYLISNVHIYKDVYIGNHYCPDFIKYLLKEFTWLRYGTQEPDYKNKKGGSKVTVDPSQRPVLFESTISKLNSFYNGFINGTL